MSETAAIAASMAAVWTVMGDDPVKVGLVASLNRPGDNITGVSVLGTALESKRLELLHDLIPRSAVIAFLADPNSPNKEQVTAEVQAAARSLGRQLTIVYSGADSEFESAFSRMVEQRVGALVAGADPLFTIRGSTSLRWLRRMRSRQSINGASLQMLAVP